MRMQLVYLPVAVLHQVLPLMHRSWQYLVLTHQNSLDGIPGQHRFLRATTRIHFPLLVFSQLELSLLTYSVQNILNSSLSQGIFKLLFLSVGIGISAIAFSFSLSSLTPSAVSTCPMYAISIIRNSHFSAFNVSPTSWHFRNTARSLLSC